MFLLNSLDDTLPEHLLNVCVEKKFVNPDQEPLNLWSSCPDLSRSDS